MPKSFELPPYKEKEVKREKEEKEEKEEKDSERDGDLGTVKNSLKTVTTENIFMFRDSERAGINSDLNDMIKQFSFTDISNDKKVKENGATLCETIGSSAEQVENIISERGKNENSLGFHSSECDDELLGDDLLEGLINRTEGFSGAEMVAVVQEAGMLAIDEGQDMLHVRHLHRAIRDITPQITREMLQFYERIAATY